MPIVVAWILGGLSGAIVGVLLTLLVVWLT